MYRNATTLLVIALSLVGCSHQEKESVAGKDTRQQPNAESEASVWPLSVDATQQARLTHIYRQNGESVLEAWQDSAHRELAIVARRDGVNPAMRIDLWALPIAPQSRPIGRSSPEAGEVRLEKLHFGPAKGFSKSVIFALGWAEEEIATPVLFANTDSIPTEVLQAQYEGSLGTLRAASQVKIKMHGDTLCALGLPAQDSSARKLLWFRGIGDRLVASNVEPDCV